MSSPFYNAPLLNMSQGGTKIWRKCSKTKTKMNKRLKILDEKEIEIEEKF